MKSSNNIKDKNEKIPVNEIDLEEGFNFISKMITLNLNISSILLGFSLISLIFLFTFSKENLDDVSVIYTITSFFLFLFSMVISYILQYFISYKKVILKNEEDQFNYIIYLNKLIIFLPISMIMMGVGIWIISLILIFISIFQGIIFKIFVGVLIITIIFASLYFFINITSEKSWKSK